MKIIQNIALVLSLALFATTSFGQIKVVAPNGDVGIGNSSPAVTLEVTRTSPELRLSVTGNEANSYFNTKTNNATATLTKLSPAGLQALIDINPTPADGTSNASFRFFRMTNTTGLVKFDVHAADGTGSIQSRFSANADSYINKNVGNVGIGTASPTQKLSVDGTAGKPGGGMWATFSDKKLKKDIQEYSEGLEEILKIRPVLFKYNGKAGVTDTETEYVGIIAQEMQQVSPRTVQTVIYQESLTEGEDENERS